MNKSMELKKKKRELFHDDTSNRDETVIESKISNENLPSLDKYNKENFKLKKFIEESHMKNFLNSINIGNRFILKDGRLIKSPKKSEIGNSSDSGFDNLSNACLESSDDELLLIKLKNFLNLQAKKWLNLSSKNKNYGDVEAVIRRLYTENSGKY